MIKFSFLLTLLSFLIIGCKTNQNGTYLIYKAERYGFTIAGGGTESPDIEVSKKLAQRFQGQKVDLTFTPKYIKLKEEGSNEEMILNLNNEYPSSPRYELSYNKGGEEIKIDLRIGSNEDKEITIFITAYPREYKQAESPNYGKFAMIECYLEKNNK